MQSHSCTPPQKKKASKQKTTKSSKIFLFLITVKHYSEILKGSRTKLKLLNDNNAIKQQEGKDTATQIQGCFLLPGLYLSTTLHSNFEI